MSFSDWRAGAPALTLCAGMMLASACTPLGLNTASTRLDAAGKAMPDLLASYGGDPAVQTAEDWTSRRAPLLRRAFIEHVYGPVPVDHRGRELSRRVVDASYSNGAGVLEEIDVATAPGPGARTFRIALALPKQADPSRPVPVIVAQNFSGNPSAMDACTLTPPAAATMGECGKSSIMGSLIRLIFGKYIEQSPNELILSRGYAIAHVHAAEVVADSSERAPQDLAEMAAAYAPGEAPVGAIGAWAATYSWTLDVLEADPRIDAGRTAIWGHSRNGKAALLAAAFDPRVEATIAHQSGKGGGTLTRAYAGESVKQITTSYPYWFAPDYAAFSDRERDIPVDQHQLIALIAPRAVFLGNGWRDVWSDPNGSFRAAQGADPAYELLGAKGLTQTGLADKATPPGEIEWFIRPAAHGIRPVDWDAFLDFLDRRLAPATASE